MTPSVAEKANALSVGDNRACSNGRSRKNEYGDDEGTGTRDGDTSQKGPLYNGGGPRKKLLCLWRIWAYGPLLQKPRRKSSNREEVGI